MPILPQPQEITDPFAKAIPGQSLTDTPKSRPYEQPAMSSKPEEVLLVLEEALQDEEFSNQISDILEVGVSCEAVTETILLKCFTEGMCTPDVAEMVKPGVFMVVAQIGEDNNIEDLILFNKNPESERLSSTEKLELMEKLAPSKLKNMEERSAKGEASEELYNPDMFSEEEEEEEEDMDSDEGSFIDMEEPMMEEWRLYNGFRFWTDVRTNWR